MAWDALLNLRGPKGDTGEQGPQGAPGATSWDGITDKPSAFTPSPHAHAQSDVTGLTAAFAGKADASHTHAQGDVTGLSTALAGKADDTAVVKLTGAQTVAGVKTLTNRSAHAGAYTPSAQPAHSATPTFDCATSNVFEPAVLTSNVTSITLSNAAAGQTVQIRFQQDATGGRTVAAPPGAKVDGGVNTAANRVSWLILTYSARGARWEGNWLRVPL